MRADYSLYLVTDRALCLGRGLIDVVQSAVKGGATMVQLREKHCDTRDFVELARNLKKHLAQAGVPLLINDRVDVALACGADGVHVGQSDMKVQDVRELMGSEILVGLSVENMDQIRESEQLTVDYLGIGPVFPTATKPDASTPWGIDGLQAARKITTLPLVAIGSVSQSNAAEIISSGINGVAVVSAICSAENVQEAAAQLKEIVRNARKNSSYQPNTKTP